MCGDVVVYCFYEVVGEWCELMWLFEGVLVWGCGLCVFYNYFFVVGGVVFVGFDGCVCLLD